MACDCSNVFWADIQGKPATFAPAPHTHVPADIVGLDSYIISFINNIQPILQVAGIPTNPPGSGESLVAIDTTTGLTYGWSGSSWISTKDLRVAAGAPAGAPPNGEVLYVNTTTDELSYWDGATWTVISGSGGTMTDNADGTYTFDNSVDPPTVIDTRANSNPITDAGAFYTGTDVETALQEIGGKDTVTDNADGTYTFANGIDPNVVIDTTADSNPIIDAGAYFTGTEVEAALQELGADKHPAADTAVGASSAISVNVGTQEIDFTEATLRSNMGIYEYRTYLVEGNINENPEHRFSGAITVDKADEGNGISSFAFEASLDTQPRSWTGAADVTALNTWITGNVSGVFDTGTKYVVRLVSVVLAAGYENSDAELILSYTQSY